MFRYRKTKQCCRKQISDDSVLLLKNIRETSLFDWRLIQKIYYEDYICWSYPNFRQNERFNLMVRQLEFKINNGVPKCILLIVEFINKITYFNKNIRHFASVLMWTHKLMMYYNRYYRMLQNERLFGKKNFLSYKNGHKLHFIAYINKREVTGIRLNKNHMRL